MGLSMKKIAVTGCAGFVGSWICEKALAKGYQVVGLDNFGSGVDFTPDKVEFYKVDLNSNISTFIKDVDAVVHAAAYAELRHNWRDVEERKRLFVNNEVATISLLEQMPDVPIVFLSSASVYGSMSNYSKDSLLTEDRVNAESIESPYAASKLACEAYIGAWSFKRQKPWHALRLVNQVGKRSHRGVIADFLKMVRTNNHIHAADSGEQRKNWVNVEDTADAIIRLLDTENIVPSGIYTITSDERWSWKDIVRVMMDMYKEKYPDMPEPFTVTCEKCLGGAIGDPLNLHVSGGKLKPYYSCDRSVELAVRDALLHMDWTK
jgi:UDP-glucose 4-epimerase